MFMKVRIVCLCVAFLLFTGLACDSKDKPKVDLDPATQKPEKGPKAPKLPPPPPKE